MQRREKLGECFSPGGAKVTLTREAGQLLVRFDGEVVMSDRMHGSEEVLAERGCEHIRTVPGAKVVVGGLGMGYTLRATLDAVGADASVRVVEFTAGIVEWNRGPLGHLAHHPLDDPRTELVLSNAVDWVKSGPAPADAILFDIDNGPEPMLSNSGWLYTPAGLRSFWNALRPGGVLGIWAASPTDGYHRVMERAGYKAWVVKTRARGDAEKGEWHYLYFGRRPHGT